MVQPFRFGEINLTAGGDPTHSSGSREAPFCIAILGDFGGHSRRTRPNLGIADRRPVNIDRDNFDRVMANFGVEVNLEIDADRSLQLRFSELEDFHPDRLIENASIFSKLRDLRARVADPETFPAVAREFGLQASDPAARTREAATVQGPSVSSVVSNIATGSLLDATVERTEQGREKISQPSRTANELDGFVRRVVAPHLVAATDPRQAETLAMLDRALSVQMRALLHVPAFQRLEAAWRAVYFLVRRIETGAQLKLYLVDVSREELEADLNASHNLTGTGAYQLLVEKSVATPGADPWAVIVGNFEFGPTRADAELLGKLAKVAQSAGAPFLAAASPRLLGCESLSEAPHPRQWTLPPDPESVLAWAALRALPEAPWLGLALPRFLLRLPYGKETDSIGSFDFEEMAQPPAHEDYLWGNPSFACALLLAQSFSDSGWDMRPGIHNEIVGLPLHVYERDGESELKPCAEALLTEDTAECILERGLMPLVSVKGQDVVQVMGLRAVTQLLRKEHS